MLKVNDVPPYPPNDPYQPHPACPTCGRCPACGVLAPTPRPPVITSPVITWSANATGPGRMAPAQI